MTQKDVHGTYFSVAPNVWGIKDVFVNVYLVRNPETNQWVLIDTGLKTAATKIKQAVKELFEPDSRPEAIILTHGHFDHTGSLKRLADEWNVPIYAHALEFPYLNGKSSYPPPDPFVGGGMMAFLSWMYPKKPINVEHSLRMLPQDGSVPFLPEWKALHTPGHTHGHVSFFRESDKCLIAGDAIVSTQQESAFSVLLQKERLSGPPKYFTSDWEAAENSVKTLASLSPRVIATGHGKPMDGDKAEKDLKDLADHFKQLAVPKAGRYVGRPAKADANGVTYTPPRDQRSNAFIALIILALIAIAWLIISHYLP